MSKVSTRTDLVYPRKLWVVLRNDGAKIRQLAFSAFRPNTRIMLLSMAGLYHPYRGRNWGFVYGQETEQPLDYPDLGQLRTWDYFAVWVGISFATNAVDCGTLVLEDTSRRWYQLWKRRFYKITL